MKAFDYVLSVMCLLAFLRFLYFFGSTPESLHKYIKTPLSVKLIPLAVLLIVYRVFG